MADEPFPYLYRTVLTLLVGPDERTYPVHKELLASKSSLVGKLIASTQLHSKIEESLRKSLSELEELPRSALCGCGLLMVGRKVSSMHTALANSTQIVQCILRRAIWKNDSLAPAALIGTSADLRPLRQELVDALHEHDWKWGLDTRESNTEQSDTEQSDADGLDTARPPTRQGDYILYDLLDHKELDILDNAVAILIKGVKKRLDQHCRNPQEAGDVVGSQFRLPRTSPRIAEMLIHALYTGRLQTMDARNMFKDTMPYDRLQVFCLAVELGIMSVQQMVVESFLEERTGPTPFYHVLFALAAAKIGSPAKRLLDWLLRNLLAKLLSVCPDGQELSLKAVDSADIDKCANSEALSMICDDCWTHMTSMSNVLKHVAETDHENITERATKTKLLIFKEHKPMFEEFIAKLVAKQRRRTIEKELFCRPVPDTTALDDDSSIWDSDLDVAASTPRRVFRCDECSAQFTSTSQKKNHTDTSCHEQFSELSPDEIKKLDSIIRSCKKRKAIDSDSGNDDGGSEGQPAKTTTPTKKPRTRSAAAIERKGKAKSPLKKNKDVPRHITEAAEETAGLPPDMNSSMNVGSKEIRASDKDAMDPRDLPFPSLYRTIVVLEIGPRHEKLFAYKEFLTRKSSVIAKHFESTKFVRIEASLRDTLAKVNDLPKAGKCFRDLAYTSGHFNCEIVCGLSKSIIPHSNITGPLDGTIADLRVMRDATLEVFAREETGPEPPESYSNRSVLWRLEANNRVEVLDLVVSNIASEIEQRLAKHAAHFAAAAVASRGLYQLPNAQYRVVEMLIHALYTGQLQAMNANGVIYSPPVYDLAQVFCLAVELDIECVQQVIVEDLPNKNLRVTGTVEMEKVILLLKEKKLEKCKLEAFLGAWLGLGGEELQEYVRAFQTER
ncbi:hypothetical protein BU16DRAFT_543942 [Lophium mytilinum]|uniref:C2H2-type domain-containing protein n=1 Tax=Lophium mytilinum TaxID=390894 RepID=A0A6A6QF58_9PEZI|nr:hypothetical protein BU16DRAFT_543942 [Lophium mytilinum]